MKQIISFLILLFNFLMLPITISINELLSYILILICVIALIVYAYYSNGMNEI